MRARVSVDDAFRADHRNVQVMARDVGVDRVRTALAGTVPGHAFTSADERTIANALLGTDIRTGVLIVLAVCYLIAIVSAGIMAVSSVLDRRQTYAQLRLAGTPLSVLHRARLAETLIPLVVMGGGSLLGGLLCAAPFVLASPAEPYGLALLGAFVGIGTLGVIVADALSRPLLRAVATDRAPQPD